MGTAGIYIFENLSNGKQYVGQSVNVEKRVMRHLGQFKTNDTHPRFYRALKKYPEECWMVRVIPIPEEGIEYLKDNLDALEKALIETYRTAEGKGYNLTLGGSNGVPNAETKAKMSIAHKSSPKVKDHLSRLHASPEHKEHLARLHSDPEFQQKRAEQLARLHSDPEFQQKRAEQLARFNQTKRKLTPEQIQQVFQMKEEGSSQQKIADHFSVSDKTIARILSGKTYKNLRQSR